MLKEEDVSKMQLMRHVQELEMRVDALEAKVMTLLDKLIEVAKAH